MYVFAAPTHGLPRVVTRQANRSTIVPPLKGAGVIRYEPLTWLWPFIGQWALYPAGHAGPYAVCPCHLVNTVAYPTQKRVCCFSTDLVAPPTRHVFQECSHRGIYNQQRPVPCTPLLTATSDLHCTRRHAIG